MTVVNPKSISGINSITTGSGSDNLLTIHTNDGTERVRVDSTGTTKIVTGIVTTLTATTGIVTTFVTNTAKVGAAVTISESGIEASGIGITVANINGGAISGRRNIFINGAMLVAQRGTSSTDNGYGSVDRIQVDNGGVDEAPTQAQVDVASGTTPYSLGFRKALKITNGNQTGGAGSMDYIRVKTLHEAQNIANSGWNYTSTSSFVTLSFWVKASVAQTYQVYLRTSDGTGQGYAFEFALTADTWTKVVETIPGNSNIQFDNDNGNGLEISILPFIGNTYTTASPTLNAWGAFSGSDTRKDMTSTWYTTNDATFEVTGIQFEVGPQATSFEHRSFAEELALCKRYYQQYVNPPINGIVSGTANQSNNHAFLLPVEMRSSPTLSISNTGNNNGQRINDGSTTKYITSLLSSGKTASHLTISFNLSGDLTNNRPSLAIGPLNTDDQTTFKISAEL